MAKLFPLESVEQFLLSERRGIQRDGDRLTWPDRMGVTSLEVREVNRRVRGDDVIAEEVVLMHTSPGLDNLPPELIANLNRWATACCLIGADPKVAAQLVSRACIFSRDAAAAENVYAPLIAMQAALMGWHADCLARGIFRMNPEQSPLVETASTSRYTDEDFQLVKEFANSWGLVSTMGGGAFTVEFPWEPGSRSRVFSGLSTEASLPYTDEELERLGGHTSLFELITAEPHPLYGNGVLARLSVPLSLEEDEGVRIAAELNRWELSAIDLPPLFGAWCAGFVSPTFVTFLPNQFCYPGFLVNLTAWARVRAERLREWFSGSEVHN